MMINKTTKHQHNLNDGEALSKNEVLQQLHQLTVEGIKLIDKNMQHSDLGFEQYFLSMLELQTRPSTSN